MSPWWSNSSSKEAKKKANGGGLFGLIKRKLKCPSGSKQISTRRHSDIGPKMGSNYLASSPSTLVVRSQNFAEKSDIHPLSLPENLSDMSQVDSGKWASRNPGSSKGSSPLLFQLPKSNHAQNGHNQTDVEGDLTDSVFTYSDSEGDEPFETWILSPQASNHVTRNNISTDSPSRPVAFATQKEREKLKPVKACVSNQTLLTSQKRHPLSRHMANLQIPQSGGFFSALDSPKSSPSRSPMGVFGPEPALTSGVWARRPYNDSSFLGSGQCASPVSALNLSQDSVGVEMATPLFWQHSRCSRECSPMPSPRMTSYGPSSRIQVGPITPLHPWAGGSNTSANLHNDAVNGKQQTHRLPLPPLAIPNNGPYLPSYSTRATIPKSPGRADLSASHGSGYSTRTTIPKSPGRADLSASHGSGYSTRTTIPKSPGRADLSASRGSGWKKGQLLGSGTFGHVYLGFNSERGEMCAMKEVTLFSDDTRSKESAQQLAQEIALLSRLQHPNIVQYYGSETVDDKLYIYLEYVSGGSIYKLLHDYGKFGEIVIRSYTRQILLGLAYLHSTNTVHRDIKGANILVDPDGRVKLADFGMAKHISGPSCSLSFKGSAHWMAPEIINNNSNGCHLVVDIWSLGCTILEMATTKPPWGQYEGVAALFKIVNSKETQEIPDHLSDDCKDFIKQCLQRAPSLRPSAVQLLDHPFVKNIASPERLIPNPASVTNAMRSLGVEPAYGGVSVLHSKGLMPRDIPCTLSHVGSPHLHSRTVQNITRRSSPSPISSPRTILGSPTPLTGAAGGVAVPSYHQVQKSYPPDFMGLTSTSRSPARFFGSPSHGLHLLDPKPDMFQAMPQGSPFFQETSPLDNDFLGNQKKHRAGKSVLVDHGSPQFLKDHFNQYSPVNIKPTLPAVDRREWC